MTDEEKKEYETEFERCTVSLATILEKCGIPTHITAVSGEGSDHFYLLSIARFPKLCSTVIDKVKSE